MNKPSILIIDDDPYSLKSLKIVLEQWFVVITASNGKDGLSIFMSTPSISAIILDLHMPGMGGVEVLEKIREKDKDIKIIIITAASCHEWARTCADLNVQGYVEKPISMQVFIPKIKDMVGVEEFRPLRELWKEEYKTKLSAFSPLIKSALRYVENNYRKNFDRNDLAARLDVTPEYLSSAFHKDTGICLKEYIILFRLDKSKKYLEQEDNLKIKDIAELVGIHDNSYFCKIFKKNTGLPPQEFRKKIRST